MDRRNFLKGLLALGAGFSILPPATTYARIWRVQREVNLVFDPRDYAGKWKFISDFKLAIGPKYEEFINVFLHKREVPLPWWEREPWKGFISDT